MRDTGNPGWLPYVAYIYVYRKVPEGTGMPRNTLEKIRDSFDGDYQKDINGLIIEKGEVSGYVKELPGGEHFAVLLAVGPAMIEQDDLDKMPRYDEHDELVSSLRKSLPEGPEPMYHIRFAYAGSEAKADGLLKRHLKEEAPTIGSLGRVRDCVLASLKGPQDETVVDASRSFMAIIPGRPRAVPTAAWTLLFELGSLAVYSGAMNRLYSERRLMFDQIDASEGDTQIRINEILAEMRRPVDEIRSEDLENILKEVTIQFSRLSALSNSMRRDQVKARGLLRRIRNLLNGWNEEPIDDHPTNTSVEIENLENLMAPFGEFVERTEALMSQLNTVLDSVRTYLGIRQQKVSIAEQASSREQLVRLVNLQEILHKLEILIVAFYLTEMARIVFETLLHESVDILTAAFIPFSILASVLLSRLLHKTH